MSSIRTRFIAATVVAALAVSVEAGVAEAAVQSAAPRPSAHLALASSDISAGSAATLRYSTAHLPAGSAVYLQERVASPGQPWVTSARLGLAGSITAPGAPAGDYAFRVLVTDDGHPVVASAPATLSVEKPQGGSSILGSIWTWVRHESSTILSEGVAALVLAWLGL